MTRPRNEAQPSLQSRGRKKTESRGDRNIVWIERFCRVPEGKLVGKPLKLTVKQKKWIKWIYDSPTRVFILTMGRKNGKSCFSACLLLLIYAGQRLSST